MKERIWCVRTVTICFRIEAVSQMSPGFSQMPWKMRAPFLLHCTLGLKLVTNVQTRIFLSLGYVQYKTTLRVISIKMKECLASQFHSVLAFLQRIVVYFVLLSKLKFAICRAVIHIWIRTWFRQAADKQLTALASWTLTAPEVRT